MSKKQQYHKDGLDGPSKIPMPELFSNHSSLGAPFVITDIDNPYVKRALGRGGMHTRARSGKFGSPLLGGLTSRSQTSRRTRRVVVGGLAAAGAVLLYLWVKSVRSYIPTPTVYPSQLETKRVYNFPGMHASGAALEAEQSPKDGSHTFHSNGLLVVNPDGRHPIHTLIEAAEKKWSNLLKSQSTTLEQAAAEYKRRYKRNPPKGFDLWWMWAQQNKVILVDEYDQIDKDMQPFRALEPADMRHRNRVMQDRPHTFTLSIMEGQTYAVGEHASLRRAKDLQGLLDKFAQYVPGTVNMSIVIDDNPALMMGWNLKERMLELAKEGEYWGPSEFIPDDDATLKTNFAKACPPRSALRQAEEGYNVTDYGMHSAKKSFIHDHPKAVDFCAHPEFMSLHGHTETGGVPLAHIAPLFTWAKTGLHNDILVTPLEQYDDDYKIYDPPFAQKTRNKLMWRGTTTGSEFKVGYNWKESQRSRLHFMSHKRAGKKEVMYSDNGKMKFETAPMKVVNDKYLDMSFAGGPAQCDAVTCDQMKTMIHFAQTMGLEDQNQYKYLMDVDGNGWSGRFHRLLSTNAVVLKSTVFPEWYADRIVPWVHYVPVKVDYSDLYDIMAFFSGSPSGKGAHEAMAERIGLAGKEFAQKHWRRIDMASYMFRLTLEYARLLHTDTGVETDFYI